MQTLAEILITEKRLSRRETEVAMCVAKGWANKTVADALFVTEKTVKFHLTNIYKKMQMKSRAQLIVWCVPRMGDVDRTPPPAPVSICPVVETVKNTAPLALPIGFNGPEAAA